jgi:ethanolamine ammonia-lyase small subunit
MAHDGNFLSGEKNSPWAALKRFTDARIALGRAGAAIPTRELLAFQLAHAQARDAVHARLDFSQLADEISALHPAPLILRSEVAERGEYLRRPDLGRRLHESSRAALQNAASVQGCDLAIVIADGLSASAVTANAVSFLRAFLPLAAAQPLTLAPVCLVGQGRVAIGDEIGFLLNARAVVVLIGERPGLSSPDSLGAYLTYDPRPGLTDERRNCISNIRAAGLVPDQAAAKLHYLVTESLRRQISGVDLKDDMPTPPLLA